MSLECAGVDLFVFSPKGLPKVPEKHRDLVLETISSRGLKYWPLDNSAEVPMSIVNWFVCRYVSKTTVADETVQSLLSSLDKEIVWEKAQKLFRENGREMWSKAYSS